MLSIIILNTGIASDLTWHLMSNLILKLDWTCIITEYLYKYQYYFRVTASLVTTMQDRRGEDVDTTTASLKGIPMHCSI